MLKKLENIFKKQSLLLQTTLVMVYEGSKSVLDNFSKFIYQLQPKTKTLAKKLERILIKLYRQNVSSLFNHIYLYIYVYGKMKKIKRW